MLNKEQIAIAALDYAERKPEGIRQGWAALDFLSGAHWALKESRSAELEAEVARLRSEKKSLIQSLEKANKQRTSHKNRLLPALKRLSFMAQTTGGTEGKDPELIAAIDEAAAIIAEYEQNNA